VSTENEHNGPYQPGLGAYAEPRSNPDTCPECECICDMGANGPCRCGCEECGCDDLHVMYPEEG